MARSCSVRLTVPLVIYGEGRSFMVMVLERRYGPRRLRGLDDDDTVLKAILALQGIKCHFLDGC